MYCELICPDLYENLRLGCANKSLQSGSLLRDSPGRAERPGIGMPGQSAKLYDRREAGTQNPEINLRKVSPSHVIIGESFGFQTTHFHCLVY